MQFLIPAHVVFVVFSFIVIVAADKQALAWMRGTKQTLDRAMLRRFHLFTWIGLCGLIVTGAFLLVPQASYLLAQPLFIMKMLLVGVLVVNGVLIGRLMDIALTRTFASLSRRELVPLMASGAFSMIGWFGALIIALSIF